LTKEKTKEKKKRRKKRKTTRERERERERSAGLAAIPPPSLFLGRAAGMSQVPRETRGTHPTAALRSAACPLFWTFGQIEGPFADREARIHRDERVRAGAASLCKRNPGRILKKKPAVVCSVPSSAVPACRNDLGSIARYSIIEQALAAAMKRAIREKKKRGRR
jgi:hypothetical protein